MPIYTNDPCDDGLFPMEPSLRSSIGIGPKITKAIDAATRDWLDEHPEATTTIEDDSITNAKLKDGSVNSRTIEDGSVTTDDIADLAVTTSKIADDAVDATKIASSAADGLRIMNAIRPGVAKVGAGLAMNGDALELDGNGDISAAVASWLNAHPEATTTVQDGAIDDSKVSDGYRLLTNNHLLAINSGVNRLVGLELGGSHAEDGYIYPSVYSTRCRTPINRPVQLVVGDVLTCSSGFEVTCRKVILDLNGSRITDPNYTWSDSITIESSGLYQLIVRTVNDESVTTPAACESALIITHRDNGFLDMPDKTLLITERSADSKVVGDTFRNDISLFGVDSSVRNLMFEQGSFSWTNNTITPSDNSKICRTPPYMPIILNAGDKIEVDDGYQFAVSQSRFDGSDVKLVRRFGWHEGTFDVVRSGLYNLGFQIDGDTAVTPDVAEQHVRVIMRKAPMPVGNFRTVEEADPSGHRASFHPQIMEQGGYSLSVTDGLTKTNSATRCRLVDPLQLRKGDTISVAAGYNLSIRKVTVYGGKIWQATSTWWPDLAGTSMVVPLDGLYVFLMRNSSSSAIDPIEAANAITIQSEILTDMPERVYRDWLPKNPYLNIPWDNVHDVTSVSHVHCETQEQFDNLKDKYDHLAISNYHPSVPCYPISGHFDGSDGILQSPNSEHAYFTYENAHLHMNVVGGYISSTTNNLRGETAHDFIRRAMKSMRLACGGGITINHPRWSGLAIKDIMALMEDEGVIALEVWNTGAERDNQTGDASGLWDGVLATGTQIFAVASPDHEIQYHASDSPYGFGYNHMIVTNVTEEEILYAYASGKFYTTMRDDGLTLSSISISASGLLSIEVSEASTYLFKTATRSVTVSDAATSATFQTQDDDIYVRVEVSRGDNKLWTNAIMLA